jgi:hypothetical protein
MSHSRTLLYLTLIAFTLASSVLWTQASARAAPSDDSTQDVHHVSFTAGEHFFQLELRQHHELFASHYIEHHIDVVNDKQFQHRSASRCIYHGHVTNDMNSRVILDVCQTSSLVGDGINGWIRAFGESYLLQPSTSSSAPHRQRGFITSSVSSANKDSATSAAAQWWDVALTRSSLVTVSITMTPHRLHRLTNINEHGNTPSDEAITHKCGVSHHSDTVAPSAMKTQSSVNTDNNNDGSPFHTSSTQRYVELLLVNDYRRYQNLTSSTESNTAFAAAIAAELYNTGSSTVFTTTPIKIVLTAQVTFTTKDPYNVSIGTCSTCTSQQIDPEELLTKFNHWRAITANVIGASHDAGHLFTGYSFSDGTTGLAGLGAMCTNAVSGGIEQSLDANGVYLGVLLTHELGHNLGMSYLFVVCPILGVDKWCSTLSLLRSS